MSLKVYTLQESNEWDDIVKSFKDYDVYWLSGYVKAFKLHGDGEPLLFYYEDGDTRGINVVMRRSIDFYTEEDGEKYFDFATPYGYGGWIIEGDNTDILFSEYKSWLMANNIVSEFVRFHPMIKNHEKCRNAYEVIELGEVVHIDLSSCEDIWNNYTSKNRNMIRKAQKNEVTIESSNSEEIYKVFKTIYDETMDKDHAIDYYYFNNSFYDSIRNNLKNNAVVYYAKKDNKIIAASIILSANGRLNYHLSGSIKEYSTFAPTNLLLNEVAIWGSKNGYKTLYLGGGVGSSEDGLLKFKKSFNKRELNKFYIGKKIVDKKIYKKLCDIKSISKNESFFPGYRK